MIKLMIFRHGLVEWNVKGLMAGGKSDVPLNLAGLGQALVLAEKLENTKIDLLLSSDLSRANQTARVVTRKNKYDFPVRLSKNLRETNFGLAEGKDFYEMKEKYSEYFALREDLSHSDTYDVKLPEGESHREVINRFLTCLEDNLSQFPNVKTVAIFTHGDILRALSKYVYNEVRTFENCGCLEMNYNMICNRKSGHGKCELHF